MIFLGAGASAPFGIPTASTLTKELRDLLRTESQDLLDEIDKYHKETKGTKPNYEEYLGYLSALTNSHELRKDHYARDFAKTHPSFKDKQKYGLLIDETHNIVCKRCNEPFICGTGKYLKPEELELKFQMTYDTIIGMYLHAGKQQLIFSTNYDPSLEIWCQKRNLFCVDGTQPYPNPEVREVMVEQRHKEATMEVFSYHGESGQLLTDRVALVRLHGSVWTYPVGDRRRIKFTMPQDKRLFLDLYQEILKNKPVLIFPGQEDRISREQWNILYQYFREQLKGDCLFVGYSFRHDALDTPIIENLKNGNIRNLGVLSPNPDGNIENLAEGGTFPEEHIIKMPAEFGSDNAIGELVQKWLPITIRNFSFPDQNKLLTLIAEWRKKREAAYIT